MNQPGRRPYRQQGDLERCVRKTVTIEIRGPKIFFSSCSKNQRPHFSHHTREHTPKIMPFNLFHRTFSYCFPEMGEWSTVEAACPRDDAEVDNPPNPREIAPKQPGDGELQPPEGKGGMAAAEMDFNKLDQAYLDPIPSEIIGKLEVERLLHTAVQKSPAGWLQTLRNIFTARSTDGWCGYRTKDERAGEQQQHPQQLRATKKDSTSEADSKRVDNSFVRTRPMFARFVQELFACGLLNRINFREKTTRFVSIFVVFKEGLKLRFIANCTRNNKSFGKPPSLLFASTESLFQALQFFGPDTFFAVADFRHWFYQIRLPPAVKHLFSLWCKGELFSFNAWPMGFSWSPFVAQGLSMTIAMLAINRSGKFAAISPRHDKGLLPDMWFVTSPDATWKSLRKDKFTQSSYSGTTIS